MITSAVLAHTCVCPGGRGARSGLRVGRAGRQGSGRAWAETTVPRPHEARGRDAWPGPLTRRQRPCPAALESCFPGCFAFPSRVLPFSCPFLGGRRNGHESTKQSPGHWPQPQRSLCTWPLSLATVRPASRGWPGPRERLSTLAAGAAGAGLEFRRGPCPHAHLRPCSQAAHILPPTSESTSACPCPGRSAR